MAIKFVDEVPEDQPKPRQAKAPSTKREPKAEALAQPVEPEMPHPKPEPKRKGRKKPLR